LEIASSFSEQFDMELARIKPFVLPATDRWHLKAWYIPLAPGLLANETSVYMFNDIKKPGHG